MELEDYSVTRKCTLRALGQPIVVPLEQIEASVPCSRNDRDDTMAVVGIEPVIL